MLDIPPETWLSWANAARIWGLAIAAIASVVSLIASIAQNNFQTIVSAKKDEALRVFQAESQERIAAANTQAAEANARAAEANEKAEQERLGRLKLEEKLAPRWLSTQQQQELRDRLSQFPALRPKCGYFLRGLRIHHPWPTSWRKYSKAPAGFQKEQFRWLGRQTLVFELAHAPEQTVSNQPEH